MTAYQIQAPSRRCAATGRELRPGERFYTALIAEAGQLKRHDYAVEAWPGPPTAALSFWQARVPTTDGAAAPPPIDDEVLLEALDRLATNTTAEQVRFRYVVALLLMRRKRLKFEDTRKTDDRDVLCLREAKSKTKFEVVDPGLTGEQLTQVQDEVLRVLGWA
jgi:hypothetical protein